MSRVPNAVRLVSLMVVLAAALAVGVSAAYAGGCKATGAQCQTAVSCCTKNCAKPFVKHGASLFGLCCPTGNRLCGGKCVDVATDANNCGTCGTVCTEPDTCGGGGVAGQCGCTPTVTCATEGFDCGSFIDDCGDTVSCGSCTAPAFCGASTENVCGTTTTTTTPPTTTTPTTTTPTTTTTTTSIPACQFECPPLDLAGRPLLSSSATTEVFCRYQTVPNDFYCKYFIDTGLLKQDHDDGFCPPVAIPSCG